MTFQPTGIETRLQRALRALAESQARIDQHNLDLAKLMEAGHCTREATAISHRLREKLAQSRRDVIWAGDRIRFGRDEAGVEPVSLKPSNTTEIELGRDEVNPSPRILESGDVAAS